MAADDSVVVEALSVEEAIIVGLTRLTATRDEVDIEILDEGTRGFLGIGSREARVRLSRRPQQETVVLTPVVPSQTSAPVVSPSVSDPVSVTDMAAAAPEPLKAPESQPAAPAAAVVAAPSVLPVVKPVATEKPATPKPAASSSRGRRASRQTADAGSLDRDAVTAAARDTMAHLLPGLSVETAIEWVDEDRPTLWVSLTGRDADSLVGPRARNLHSLQYLFRALIYQQADGNYNVVVDADGYRRRRRRSLESLAQKKADQAVEQGQAIQLRAMPAHERRIIHMLLKADDRVSTESSGKGRDRAITIVPNGATEHDRS